MLNSIKLKNVATYPPEGEDIEGLQPISFIYGANGSGKTTISNFIAHPENPKYDECQLDWDQDQSLTTYVYNKDFREQHFFQADIPGVFTLGKATSEQMKALNAKQEEIKELRKTAVEERRRLSGFDDQLSSEADRFRDTVWDTYNKPFKEGFKDAFKGCGTKESFKNRLQQEFKDNTADLENKEDLLKRAETIFGERPQAINKLPLPEFTRLKEIEESEVWEKAIIGKSDVPIAELIDKLGNSDWVDQGQAYIEGATCPFCQQETVNENFKKQLEDFFDESYKNAVKEVKELGEEYVTQSENVLLQMERLHQREKEYTDTKIDWENFETEIELLKSRFTETKRLMADKLKEPGRKQTITLLSDFYDQLALQLAAANKAIDDHNKVVTNFNSAHTLLVRSVWRYIVEEAKPTIEAHQRAIQGITKAKGILLETQKKTTEKGKELKKEIEDLTAGAGGVEFSEMEMNKTLESYGFHSFKIVKSPAKENCYQIQRENGTLVESTLSEGEVTFITFLYFYQLAKGGHSEEAVNERRVLIVDDPISSLDSNVLFVVSSLLRKYMDEIRNGEGNITQLILLTHNAYFHKQMAIINGRDQELANTAYWILRKGRKYTSIESHGMKNPISSTYELLWRELRSDDKKSSVMLQNAMRRILEYYFTVFGQFTNIKNLPSQFKTIEEQLVCKSLLSWVNDGSHDIADEIHVSDYDETEQRYKDVFRTLFDANGQLGHYNLMMGIKNGEIVPTEEATSK